jgi:hypothetical protein
VGAPGGLSAADTEDRQIAVLQDGQTSSPNVAMPRCPRGPKESTRWRPCTPVAEENDMDWALKDIPSISLVILYLEYLSQKQQR